MNNQTNRKQTPRREPRMPGMKGNSGTGEKAKDFKGAITRLVKEIKVYKVLIIIALILSITGAVISILAPDKLANLTDEVSAGLVINKDNLNKLQEKMLGNTNFAYEQM